MKEAYYFSHDSNARTDPKIMAMMNVYKTEGYGRFWITIEMLREQTDYKLKHCQWVTNALAMAMLCDTNSAEEFINDCVNQFELLQSDGVYFWSPSLIRRMEMKQEQREKRREAGRKGAENRWNNGNAMAMPEQPNSNDMANDSKEKKGNRKEKKSKDYISIPEMNYVHITQKEYDNIISKYGQLETDKKIFELNTWKGSKGGVSKDDNLTLQNWLRRDNEKHANQSDKQSGPLGVKYSNEQLIRRDDY